MGSIPITRSNPLPMRRLYEARDRIEAQFLRDYLDRHLIPAAVLGDYLAGAVGELPALVYPTVWVVEDEDLPRARELLECFLQETAGGTPAWTCAACGEAVEAGFDLCWNCGHARD